MSVAVITGSASGIGAGLAREAARRGMDVVLADLDAAALEAVATEIGGKTIAQACDVTNLKDMQLLAEETFRVFGRVDLLFNNAGILRTGLTWDIDPEDWNKVLNVNIMGIVNSLHAFVPKCSLPIFRHASSTRHPWAGSCPPRSWHPIPRPSSPLSR